MEKIFVVIGSDGYNENYTEWAAVAVRSESQAKALAAEFEEAAAELTGRSRLDPNDPDYFARCFTTDKHPDPNFCWITEDWPTYTYKEIDLLEEQ